MVAPKVINIADAPLGWERNPEYVLIDRTTEYGNIVEIGKTCPICYKTHGRTQTINCYKLYVTALLEKDPTFREKVKNLTGKILVCHCSPKPCHGNVLVDKWYELNNVAKGKIFANENI